MSREKNYPAVTFIERAFRRTIYFKQEIVISHFSVTILATISLLHGSFEANGNIMVMALLIIVMLGSIHYAYIISLLTHIVAALMRP